MPSQPQLKGIRAAPGLAQGAAFWVDASAMVHSADSLEPTIDLSEALALASSQLVELMDRDVYQGVPGRSSSRSLDELFQRNGKLRR